MKKAILIIFCLGIFAVAQPVFAECPEVKIILQHSEMAITLTISGSPQEIVLPDGSLKCPTPEELINKLLGIFPGYVLKEYHEFKLNR